MARLMPLRALGLRGGSDFDVIQAMLYASGLPNQSLRLPERRADVINLSLGRQGVCSSAIQDAVRLARQQGLSVVAAAGNDASNRKGVPMPIGSPANCAGVISVGAVGARAEVADYSNSGAELTLVAPGGDLSSENTGSGNPDGVFSSLAAFNGQGVRVATYGFMQGTSMAAPHVSAVIALAKYINPNLTPAQIDQLIASGQFTVDLGTAGRDSLSGYGLINASKALQASVESINAPPPLGVVEVSPSALSLGSTLSEAEFELRRNGPTSETVTRIAWTNSAQVQVLGKTNAFDSISLLGKFVVRITRGSLSNSIFPVVTIDTSNGRRLLVNLSIEPAPAAGTIGRRGSAGTIYMLVVDATNNTTLQTLTLEPRDGTYAYKALAPAGRPLYLVAGHDLDNDYYLCGRGEVCGDYPPVSSGATSFTLTASLRGLDFALAPSGGFGAAQLDQNVPGRWRALRKGASP
jgi:serine protease